MRRLDLVADCSRCEALCCVLLPYSASSGFGNDKPGGTPCQHLAEDNRCGIHSRLRESGWPGCTVFDCFGAGQQLTQVTYAGRSWRDPGTNRGEMAAVLSVVRLLHEALSHLVEVARRSPSPHAADLLDLLAGLADGTPDELLALDLDPLLGSVSEELRAASRRVRGDASEGSARPDLSGQDLRHRDLSGADLRGALLIRADLRGVDLGPADLLGADVRDADVRGARLADVLFLSQSQANALRGNGLTELPAGLSRPGHW